MAKRPVDIAVNNFLKGMGAVLALFVGLQVWIFIVQDQGPNEAFIWSIVASVILTLLVLWQAKTRPADAPLTWGAAMAGSAFAFGFMLLIYGIVPHQWLVYADSELLWRSDRFVEGPDVGLPDDEGLVAFILPFRLPYLIIRDLIAVVIYGVGLANLFLLPMANKLKAYVLQESHYRELVIEGLVAISEGENPRQIETRLQGFLR